MAAAALCSGQVFRLFCRFIDPPKPKFLVLAYVTDDGRARLFAINTEATQLQKQTPALANHQLDILQADYPEFLKWDSVLCCSELVGGFTAAELEDVLLNKPECLVGVLKKAEINRVRAVVEKTVVLAVRDQERILTQLKSP